MLTHPEEKIGQMPFREFGQKGLALPPLRLERISESRKNTAKGLCAARVEEQDRIKRAIGEVV